MTVTMQILFGSVVLIVCSIVHVSILVATVSVMRRLVKRIEGWSRPARTFGLLSLGFGAVVAAHTMQIWIWAFTLMASGALETFETAMYFALVTSTTVGYGDLTLGESFRIFGAFAGVTGLLTFGLSTAILVGLFERLLPKDRDTASL